MARPRRRRSPELTLRMATLYHNQFTLPTSLYCRVPITNENESHLYPLFITTKGTFMRVTYPDSRPFRNWPWIRRSDRRIREINAPATPRTDV